MTDVTYATPNTPLDPHAAKIMIGDVWTRTFRTFRANPWKYLALALLPYPFAILAPLLKVSLAPQAAIIPSIVLMILQYFFQFVGQSASMYGASRYLSGTGWTLGESIGVGIRRFFPLIGIGLVVGIPLIAVTIGLILLGKTGLVIGLLLIIPVSMVLAAFLLAQQACIIEGRGPIESLKRSAFLSRHNRWRLIGILLIFVLIPLIAILAVLVLGVILVATLRSSVVSLVAGVIGVLTIVPLALAYQAILTICMAVAFVDLRYLKEGGGPRENVIGVFD